MASSPSSGRGFSGPLLWTGIGVGAAGVFVLVTRSGVDILVLLAALFFLLLLERTFGDWVADTLGSGPAALVFAGIAIVAVIYVSSGGGRARASAFFAAAQARGYRAAYMTYAGQADPSAVPSLHVATPEDRSITTPTTAVATAGKPAPTGPVVTGDTPVAPVAPVVRPPASGVRITRAVPSVNVIAVGQPVMFRAYVTAEDDGALPAIEFSVDGHVVGKAVPASGVATLSWSTRVPGQYVMRARLPGSFAGGMSLSSVITVLPGRTRARNSPTN